MACHLTLEEREVIAQMRRVGRTQAAIAQQLAEEVSLKIYFAKPYCAGN